jgi:hypothetical protein
MPLARILPLACSLLALAVSLATAAVVATGGLPDWRLIQGAEPPSSPPAAERSSRLQFPTQVVEEGEFTNHMVSLTFNWHWDASSGWSRPDPAEPSVALTLESWYRGLAELNLDMRPPRGSDKAGDWPGGRAMGFAASHDGSYTTLSLGGPMFNPAGAGLKLTAGTTAEPLVLLHEGPGLTQPLVVVRSETGVPSVSLRGGPSPNLAIGLGGEAAEVAPTGILRFSGSLPDQPLISVVGIGSDATLLSSQPERSEDGARFTLGAGGRIEWRGAGGGTPVALAPAFARGARSLRLDAELAAASLRLGESGAPLSGLWATQVAIAAAPVAARSSGEQRIHVPGIRADSIVLASGPDQPAGIALTGARAIGADALALAFVNVADEARAPAAGPYMLLVLEVELQ